MISFFVFANDIVVCFRATDSDAEVEMQADEDVLLDDDE
jgi:hypothetical protein